MKLPVQYDELEWWERKPVRDEYVRLQDGKCWHCKNALTDSPSVEVRTYRYDPRLFPINFLKWPVHLHHDRNSGLTLGAVHARCNAYLWQEKGE